MKRPSPVQVVSLALSKEAGHDEIHPFWAELAAMALQALRDADYTIMGPIDEEADQEWYDDGTDNSLGYQPGR